MNITNDLKAQVSVELILIMASIIIVILLAINIYQDYIHNMNSEIKNNELDTLLDKLNLINNHIKK